MPYSIPRGPECVECGSTRTRGMRTGYSEDGQRIRDRRCDECGFLFLTVEVPVLTRDNISPPFSWFDPEYRLKKRLDSRKQRGYHGGRTKPSIEGVAQILVSVRVKLPRFWRVERMKDLKGRRPFSEDGAGSRPSRFGRPAKEKAA